MTACIKLMRTLDSLTRPNGEHFCSPCVYFSRNLDPTDYPVLAEQEECCGLGFLPGDAGCAEMRTDSCSIRKKRA